MKVYLQSLRKHITGFVVYQRSLHRHITGFVVYLRSPRKHTFDFLTYLRSLRKHSVKSEPCRKNPPKPFLLLRLGVRANTKSRPALFDAAPGVKVVIGMKTAVSHLAAIDFNTAFLTALCEGETVKAPLKKGKIIL